MNQMEHNVKIKSYLPYNEVRPYVRTLYQLNRPQTYPNKMESERMCERFRYANWPRYRVPAFSIPEWSDRSKFMRDQQISVFQNHHDMRAAEERHRTEYLEEVKRKHGVAREEFARQTFRERPVLVERNDQWLPPTHAKYERAYRRWQDSFKVM